MSKSRMEEEEENLLEWFLNVTSIGGLCQLKRTTKSLNRAVWIALFLIGTHFTLYTVKETLEDYYARKVTTVVTLENSGSLSFPAITVCPMSPVSCLQLDKRIDFCQNNNCDSMAKLCHLYVVGKCFDALVLHDLLAHDQLLHGPKCVEAQEDAKPANISYYQHLNWPFLSFHYMYSTLSNSDKLAIAHPAADLVRSCIFKQQTSGHCLSLMRGDNRVVSATGVCHTFDAEVTTSLPGRVFGLELELFLGNEASPLNGVVQAEGVRVLVHEHHKLAPVASGQGVSVRPHTSTNVVLDVLDIHRESSPYASNCSQKWKFDVHGIYFVDNNDDDKNDDDKKDDKESKELAYDTNLCKSVCLSEVIFEGCGCVMPYLLELRRRNARICNLAEAADNVCVFNLTEEPKLSTLLNETCTNCPLECDERQFEVRTSAETWPTTTSWMSLAQKYRLQLRNQTLDQSQIMSDVMAGRLGLTEATELTALKEYVQQNLIRLNVYFDSLQRKVVREEPKYDAMGLMSSLGGAVSIYLGLSVISICEIVEVLVKALYRPIYRSRRVTQMLIEANE